MLFNFTEEDVNRSALVEPGVWYPVEIQGCKSDKPAKDGSKLDRVSFKILKGPFIGAILYTQFSEKAQGFAIPMFAAILKRKIVAGDQIELKDEAVKGKQIEVYVTRTEYNGQPQNNVANYRPLQTEG